MDGIIEIFLPEKVDLGKLGFRAPYFSWGGINYEQGPPEFKFGDNFLVKVNNHSDFYGKKGWPDEYKKLQMKCLEISGNGPDIYMRTLYGLAIEDSEYNFRGLLDVLLANQDRWIFIFSHQFDGYVQVSKGGVDDCLSKFSEISGKIEKGFMIYK